MKILLVSFADHADHQDTLFGLYEGIKNRYDTYLMAIKKPKVRIEHSSHVWLVDCPKRPGIEKQTFNLVELMRIINRIKKERFDVIYFESLHVWNIAIMLALGNKVRKYHVIHDVIPHDGDKQVWGVNLMNKLICRMADTVVLRNRKYIKSLVKRYGVRSNKVKHLDLWRRFPEYTAPMYSKSVLFFGRINPYKGANNLLEIVKMCPDIQFDVVGRVDPQMIPIVDMLSKEKNVRINNDYVSDDDMKKAFASADWVLLPYNSATQSGIIIDSYKLSRPVIAFNVGAISEQVVNGKTGYIIEAGNNKAFANQLKRAIAMPGEEYEKMCRYSYNYGKKKYSSNCAAERFTKLIKEDRNDYN